MTRSQETCTAHTGQLRELWKLHGETQQELNSLIAPLVGQLSMNVAAVVDDGESVAARADHHPTLHNLPYGDAYTLPPTLFSPLGERDEQPAIPSTELGRQCLAWMYRFRRQHDPAGGGLPKKEVLSPSILDQPELAYRLNVMHHQGVMIDPKVWNEYKQTALNQYQQGNRYCVDEMGLRRVRSAGNTLVQRTHAGDLLRASAVGRMDRYYAITTDTLDRGGRGARGIPTGFLYAPVGEYGPEIADSLLRSTAGIITIAHHSLGSLAREVA